MQAERQPDGTWTILCFAGVDWSSHRQRAQLLMASFARRGHRVLYIDNLGVRMPRPRDAGRVVRRLANWLRTSRGASSGDVPGVRVDSPILPPLHQARTFRRIACRSLVRRLRRRLPSGRPLVVWTYLPVPIVMDIAEELAADLLVYDWADDAAERVLTRSERVRHRIASWEDRMARRSDLVLVASAELLERRGSLNPRTHLVPHGAKPATNSEWPLLPEVARLPHPRVGFVGSISEWVDLALVDDLARARPEWSFVMVGPVKTKVGPLRKRANVVFTGERPYEEIPTLLSAFDSAIIPYRVTAATEAASPLKLREYLAHGLPIVSVDIPDVRPFSPEVRIASGPAQFVAALERAIGEGRKTPQPRALPWSWDECAAEITPLMEEILAGK